MQRPTPPAHPSEDPAGQSPSQEASFDRHQRQAAFDRRHGSVETRKTDRVEADVDAAPQAIEYRPRQIPIRVVAAAESPAPFGASVGFAAPLFAPMKAQG